MKKALLIALWMLLGAALTIGFVAYRQPDLLFDAANTRYCG